MRLHGTRAGALALTFALGCGGDDGDLGTSTQDPTETSTTGETSSDPTTQTTAPETTQNTSDPTSTTADTSEDDTSSGSDSGEQVWGTCRAGCRDAADCCPAFGGDGCPDVGANEWACDNGFCEKIGCTEDSHCASVLPPPLGMDLRCRQVDGVGECVLPCADDANCGGLLNDETCSGVADDASTYCAEEADPPRSEICEDDADCDGLGVCDLESGACVCSDSDDCTDGTLDTCVIR